ncbi:MAG TPA: sigma-70 family RNA polymerase sigma factor [Sedimentisphaerales bacterium]|nr:sigma-70 family RNA polymerase sigma factor [Sedimentisphaerales bacterium]HRS09887.1 sigma-70 family RNA polymerase sigma factor [Sedimentisphaerales bacterium]HRV46463.1 sigma-70 family RNA polymerase sigma factor [Sedimentisphaerales bacterium]
MLQDKRLIWRLQRGDVDALRLIYDKYKLDLLKLSMLLTGDVHRSEDAVQDVFLKLAESFDRVDDHGNLRNFLITCLMNRIRTLRRDGQRHQMAPLDDAAMQAAPVSPPDQWAVANEQMQRISRVMAELPAEQREVVTLRFKAGLGFPEIARIQNAPVNTVQGRYRYGLEKLRALLDSEVET